MRWTGFQWHPSSEESDGNLQDHAASEAGHPVAREERRKSSTFSWSSSPALQKIFHGLEEQQRMVEQLKRYLEERLTPFQRHAGEHQRHIDQALRQLENRLKPFRKYVQVETQNMEGMKSNLDSGLRDQFEAFEQFLSSQQAVLEAANQFIADQPGPLHTYVEKERQALEIIYRDLEERLGRFLENLTEQQKIVESLCEQEVITEYEAMAEYLEQRQKAFERYVRLPDYRPAELFSQLEEAADHYKGVQADQNKIFAKIFEETRLADEKLRQAMSSSRTPPLLEGPEDDSRFDGSPDNPDEAR